jgi:Peptidase family C54.
LLGGKPGLAYYMPGYTEDKLIYLDPHFVQVIKKLFFYKVIGNCAQT